MKKYYAVVRGREGPSIYEKWEECHANISGYSGAVYKSFSTYLDAEKFIESYGYRIIKHEKDEKDESNIDLNIEMSAKKKVPIIIKKENPFLKISDLGIDLDQYKRLVVYTDGSCSNQGTVGARAGSGVYFSDFDLRHSSRVPGKQTNNRAELFAVILALRFVKECIKNKERENGRLMIEIHLDSTYVKNNLGSNNVVNLDLWDELLELLRCPLITVKWVKELAHSGNVGNDIADELAKVYAFAQK